MGGSSSRSEERRPSAQEIALASSAAYRDSRFESAFRPLEKEAIDELDSANLAAREKLLTGRSNADLSQQAGNGGFGKHAGDTTKGFRRANTIGKAISVANSDGRTLARTSLDADTLNVIKTGQGVARETDNMLTTSARLENSKARNILNAEGVVDFAKGRALGDIVTSGVGGHFAAKDRAFATKPIPPGGGPPAYRHSNNDLSFYSKRLRAGG